MPEINLFTNNGQLIETIPENFKEKRKIGENDNYICELIRNDSVEEFIIFVNKTNLSLHSIIEPSIFETNLYLIKNKNYTLIEYAAFFGSIQIFRYLVQNNVKLNSSLWNYAIHGYNPEIIHLLEEHHVQCNNDHKLIESIKCHHNKLVDYFLNMNQYNIQTFFPYILKYHNYKFIQKEFINENVFFDLCKNDYILFVQNILPSVNINSYTKYGKIFRRKKEEDSKSTLEILSRSKTPRMIHYQKTALHIAIEKENIEIVELLLACKDIDINAFSISNLDPCSLEDKKTALHLAVEKSNTEIVKLLLENQNIDVNCIETIYREPFLCRKTALQLSIENENAEIAKLLLSCPNIDVNCYMIKKSDMHTNYKEKRTALYMAVEKDNIEIVYLLCQYPCTNSCIGFKSSVLNGCFQPIMAPNIRIRLAKKTPFQLASENNNQTICQILMLK